MPALPPLTPEQRADALHKAQETRTARAELRASLKNRTVTLAQVITDPDEVAGKTKVSYLLQSVPGVGPARARQIMDRAGIADNRRVRGLTSGQRAALEHEFAA